MLRICQEMPNSHSAIRDELCWTKPDTRTSDIKLSPMDMNTDRDMDMNTDRDMNMDTDRDLDME